MAGLRPPKDAWVRHSNDCFGPQAGQARP